MLEGGVGKQKLTGRRRKRAKAAAARHAANADGRQRQAAMEAATGEQGLFAFINTSLGHGSEAAAKLEAAGVYGPDEGAAAGVGGRGVHGRQQTAGGAALAAAVAAAGGGGSQQRQGAKQKQQQQPDRKGLVGSQNDVAAAKVGCPRV